MYEKRHEKLLNDAIGFFQLIGGANELAEAGWDPNEIMDEMYISEIEDLIIEWIPEEKSCINDIEECLKAEGLLSKFFKNEILEIMNN